MRIETISVVSNGRRFFVRPFFSLGAGLLFLLCACESRPSKELALADVAIRAAQKVKAESLATDEFRKAENLYLRAKKDFTDGYYDTSRKFASEARIAAEKAEFSAIFKQRKMKGKSEESSDSLGGAEQ